MTFFSGVAIYFIIWWLSLFAVLPWGIRNADEEELVVEPGHDAGAPVRARLVIKFAITTVVATVLFAIVYWLAVTRPISFNDIPFMPKMRLY